MTKVERPDACPYHMHTQQRPALDCMECAIARSRTIVQPSKPSGPWKCGDEFLPYHPSASHCSPDYRDGWNDCFKSAQQRLAENAEIVAVYDKLHQHNVVGGHWMWGMVAQAAESGDAEQAARDHGLVREDEVLKRIAAAVKAEREAFTRTCRAIEEVATTKANRLELLNPMRSWHDGKRASAEFLLSWISARSTKPDTADQPKSKPKTCG